MNNILNKPVALNIYGRQPVIEALKSENHVLEIMMARDISGKSVKHIKNGADKRNIKIHYVEKNEIQKLVGAVVHQGIAATVQLNTFLDDTGLDNYLANLSNPVILILDQIHDPHNIGAILRTAEITNVDLIVIPHKGGAPINATVAKTSAGAVFRIKIHQTKNLNKLISYLQNKNIFVFASAVTASKTIFQTDFTTPVAIIIGNEDKGVRKNLQSQCDELIKIPQLGKINSLNASVSSAVISYEIIRQRYFN